MKIFEVNFDGLIGPTHNYAGLAFGNLAADSHEGQVSSPRQAALQGLEKMWALHQMGLPQGVLPPHERPCVHTLRRLEFTGTEAELLAQAQREAPNILASVSSSSTAWVANAATVSPFPDTEDGKTHITPANLVSMFHRSIEVETTARILKVIFSGDDYCHHSPLPPGHYFADEGAANHTRLCGGSGANSVNDSDGASDGSGGGSSDSYGAYGTAGVALFVYGVSVANPGLRPRKFPARQTLQASEAIARSHRLDPARTVFAQQNPAAIDAGVFHNDVIATGNRDTLLYHEQAFTDTKSLREQLAAAFNGELHFIEVPAKAVSLTDAVNSYLFNSQLVTLPGDNRNTIIAPMECEEITPVRNYLEQLASHPRIANVLYKDLRQSMQNGGGPACLRLRVVMSEPQLTALPAKVILNETLYTELRSWIAQHYREQLTPADLTDPALLNECRTALDALSQILGIGSVYEFQQSP
ncbi:MAG: N-succinylarginine dihydrolase [Pseudohongiellaceae bacterium]